jgi:acetoin utilization protein AcuB
MEGKYIRLIDLLDDISSGKDVFFQSVRIVNDVMTGDVRSLGLDDTIEACIKFMKANKVRHIPIVDSPGEENIEKCLIGVVSQRDIFRQISPYLGKLGEESSDSRALKQPLIQILTRDPISVTPQTPITEAINIMIDNHIDMLPVLLEQELVGVVTSADILKLFVWLDAIHQLYQKTEKKKPEARFIDLLSGDPDKAMVGLSSMLRTVKDIMTEQVVCLDRQENIARAIEVMQEGHFRHIPVVEKQDKLVGLVSDRDILRQLPFQNKAFQQKTRKFRAKLFDVAPNDPAVLQSLNHIMNQDVTYVLPSCDFYVAVKMLHETKISCLPVVDKQKKVLGMVTVTDVMRGLLAAYTLFEKCTV